MDTSSVKGLIFGKSSGQEILMKKKRRKRFIVIFDNCMKE